MAVAVTWVVGWPWTRAQRGRRCALSAAVPIALVGLSGHDAGAANPCVDAVPLYSHGRLAARVCPADAPARHLTVVDRSEQFVPRALRGEPGHELAYAQVYRALAAENWSRAPAEASVDRYLELWGVFPSFRVLRDRLADDERHQCHEGVDDEALASYGATLSADERTAPRPRDRAERRDAIRALQQHLACDEPLGADAVDRHFAGRTVAAVALFQRRHMIVGGGDVDRETRELLVTDSRELDFRAVLRSLRERVVDATGIIEDGFARGEWGRVLDRTIEPARLHSSAGHGPLRRGRDVGVRAHGTVNYTAVARGDGSHGYHRLFTHHAVRLAGFLLSRRPFVTDGQVHERYQRTVAWRGQTIAMRRSTRGYVRELDPPVPVRVLGGRILGSAQEPIPDPFVLVGEEAP
jgi:hypothetical protein